jgi:hypothetical protein
MGSTKQGDHTLRKMLIHNAQTVQNWCGPRNNKSLAQGYLNYGFIQQILMKIYRRDPEYSEAAVVKQ